LARALQALSDPYCQYSVDVSCICVQCVRLCDCLSATLMLKYNISDLGVRVQKEPYRKVPAYGTSISGVIDDVT